MEGTIRVYWEAHLGWVSEKKCFELMGRLEGSGGGRCRLLGSTNKGPWPSLRGQVGFLQMQKSCLPVRVWWESGLENVMGSGSWMSFCYYSCLLFCRDLLCHRNYRSVVVCFCLQLLCSSSFPWTLPMALWIPMPACKLSSRPQRLPTGLFA